MEKLKRELPYYDECNTAGIEMFRNWAKARRSLWIEKGISLPNKFQDPFQNEREDYVLILHFWPDGIFKVLMIQHFERNTLIFEYLTVIVEQWILSRL